MEPQLKTRNGDQSRSGMGSYISSCFNAFRYCQTCRSLAIVNKAEKEMQRSTQQIRRATAGLQNGTTADDLERHGSLGTGRFLYYLLFKPYTGDSAFTDLQSLIARVGC